MSHLGDSASLMVPPRARIFSCVRANLSYGPDKTGIFSFEDSETLLWVVDVFRVDGVLDFACSLLRRVDDGRETLPPLPQLDCVLATLLRRLVRPSIISRIFAASPAKVISNRDVVASNVLTSWSLS